MPSSGTCSRSAASIDVASIHRLRPASVDEWVAAFKQKRDEIVANRCPAARDFTASTSDALPPPSGGPGSEIDSSSTLTADRRVVPTGT